jgi:cell division protein FtsQ
LGRRHNAKKYSRRGNPEKRRRPIKHVGLLIKMVTLVVLVASMSLVFILIHDLVTQIAYFRVKNLVIGGLQRLSLEQIRKQADIPHGINMLSINLSLVRKRLLVHPWIAEATVNREIPNEIHVSIMEHIPLAVVDLGRKYLISDTGIIFKEKEISDPDNLPIVLGLRYSDIKISGKNNRSRLEKNRLPSADAPSRSGDRNPNSYPLNAVMEILHLGQKKGSILPNDRIKQIRVDKDIGLTLYPLDNVREIKLGYNDFSSKYDVLRKVLKYIKTGKIKNFADFDSIDLNNLNRVVLHPIKPAKGHKEV